MNKAQKIVLKTLEELLKKRKISMIRDIDLTYYAHKKGLNWKEVFGALEPLEEQGKIYTAKSYKYYARTKLNKLNKIKLKDG